MPWNLTPTLPSAHTAVAALVLLYALCVVVYDAATGKSEYAAFKQLTETCDRQRFYTRWLVKSALLFLVGGVFGLALLGHLGSLKSYPQQLALAHAALARLVPSDQISPQFLMGVGLGALAAVLFGSIGLAFLATQKKKPKLVLGDIEALMPRNAAEMRLTALLSLNAGLSEEIFFRLLLPLAMVQLFGHPIACFVAAVLFFAIPHAYQGLIGMVAVTFAGLILTAIYVATGSLWIVMAIHAAIDLNGLVLRPAIGWLIQSRRQPQPAASL